MPISLFCLDNLHIKSILSYCMVYMVSREAEFLYVAHDHSNKPHLTSWFYQYCEQSVCIQPTKNIISISKHSIKCYIPVNKLQLVFSRIRMGCCHQTHVEWMVYVPTVGWQCNRVTATPHDKQPPQTCSTSWKIDTYKIYTVKRLL